MHARRRNFRSTSNSRLAVYLSEILPRQHFPRYPGLHFSVRSRQTYSDRRHSSRSFILPIPTTSMPLIQEPSPAFFFGTRQHLHPSFFAKSTVCSTPPTGYTWPFNPSSPTTITFLTNSSGRIPNAARRAAATGRSYLVPCFLISAGERFTVILFGRDLNPCIFQRRAYTVGCFSHFR